MTEKYDPENVKLTVNGVEITGFAEDSLIEINPQTIFERQLWKSSLMMAGTLAEVNTDIGKFRIDSLEQLSYTDDGKTELSFAQWDARTGGIDDITYIANTVHSIAMLE